MRIASCSATYNMDSQSKILILSIILSFICGCWIGTLHQFNSANNSAQLNISIHMISEENKVVRVTSERVDQPDAARAVNIITWIPQSEEKNNIETKSDIDEQYVDNNMSFPDSGEAAHLINKTNQENGIQIRNKTILVEVDDVDVGSNVTCPSVLDLVFGIRQCSAPPKNMDVPVSESCPEFTQPDDRNLTIVTHSIMADDNDVSAGRVTSSANTYLELKTLPTRIDMYLGMDRVVGFFMSTFDSVVEFWREAQYGDFGNKDLDQCIDSNGGCDRIRVRVNINNNSSSKNNNNNNTNSKSCEEHKSGMTSTTDLLHTATCWNSTIENISRDRLENYEIKTCVNTAFRPGPALDLAGLYAHSKPPLSPEERFTYPEDLGDSWGEFVTLIVDTVEDVMFKAANVTSNRLQLWWEEFAVFSNTVVDNIRKSTESSADILEDWLTEVQRSISWNDPPKMTVCDRYEQHAVGECGVDFDVIDWMSQMVSHLSDFEGFKSVYRYFQTPSPRERACGGYSNTYAHIVCLWLFDVATWIEDFVEKSGKLFNAYVVDPLLSTLTDFQYLREKMRVLSATIAEATRNGLDFGDKISVSFNQAMEQQVITAFLHEIQLAVGSGVNEAWATCLKVMENRISRFVWRNMKLLLLLIIIVGGLAKLIFGRKARQVKPAHNKQTSGRTRRALERALERMEQRDRSLTEKIDLAKRRTHKILKKLHKVYAKNKKKLEVMANQDDCIEMMNESNNDLNEELWKARGRANKMEMIKRRELEFHREVSVGYKNADRRQDAERREQERFLVEQLELAENAAKEQEEEIRDLASRLPSPAPDVSKSASAENNEADSHSGNIVKSASEEHRAGTDVGSRSEVQETYWKKPPVTRSSSSPEADLTVEKTINSSVDANNSFRGSASYHIDTRGGNTWNAEDGDSASDTASSESLITDRSLSRQECLAVVSRLLFPPGPYKPLTKLQYLRMKICQMGLWLTEDSQQGQEGTDDVDDDVLNLLENSAPRVPHHDLPSTDDDDDDDIAPWVMISLPTPPNNARHRQAEEDEAVIYLEALDVMAQLAVVHPNMAVEDLRRLAHLQVWRDRWNVSGVVLKLTRQVNLPTGRQTLTIFPFSLQWLRGRRYQQNGAVDYGRYFNYLGRAARYMLENINWIDLLKGTIELAPYGLSRF